MARCHPFGPLALWQSRWGRCRAWLRVLGLCPHFPGGGGGGGEAGPWGWGLGYSNLRVPGAQLECHYLQPPGDLGCFKQREGWDRAVWSLRPYIVQFPPQRAAAGRQGA